MMNRETLDNRNDNSLKKQMGIYVHIPFCVKKCAYCDFLSAPSDDKTIRAYVEAVIKEIYATKGTADVPTIFIGGGTPSILDAAYIQSILQAIYEKFDVESDAEITIECNPGTISLAKLLTYKESGINRISFGLQSTDDKELKSIGRIHTYDQFNKSYEMARRAGFDNINIDLIAALPDQTIASWENTVRKVIDLQPEHISAYSLILEEGTQLYDVIEKERKQGIDRVPCEENEREMYYLTNELLEKAGYHHYEISNYAKKGFECQHNLSYWSPDNYIGFGIGAASYVNDVRYKNIDDIDEYLMHLSDPNNIDLSKIRMDVSQLTKENKMEEFMFLGLRRTNGISKNEFYKRFGVSYDTIYGKVTKKFLEQELLIHVDDRIFLSKRGIDVSNSVMCEFLMD